MSNLLPVLKNRSELDRQKDRGMFVDELFGNEHSPILMYGVDKGAYLEYSASTDDEQNQQTKRQALENLAKLEVPFQVEEMPGLKIAMAQHEYAAEKILDPEFLKKMAAELGTQSMVVGIPMKGFLAAVPKGQGEANLYSAVLKQYQNPQTYAISDALYYILDGKIEMMGNNKGTSAAGEQDGLLDMAGRNDDRGKVGFVIKVGHPNEDELAQKIQTAFQQAVLHGMKDPNNFNGMIDFHISPEHNKLTPALETRIKTMAKNISERGAVQLMGAFSGEGFKVRFFYGTDQLLAETVETEPVQLKQNMKKAAAEKATPSPANAEKPAKKPWWKFW